MAKRMLGGRGEAGSAAWIAEAATLKKKSRSAMEQGRGRDECMRVVNGVKFWRAVQAERGRPWGEAGYGVGAAPKARAQVTAASRQRARLCRRGESIGVGGAEPDNQRGQPRMALK